MACTGTVGALVAFQSSIFNDVMAPSVAYISLEARPIALHLYPRSNAALDANSPLTTSPSPTPFGYGLLLESSSSRASFHTALDIPSPHQYDLFVL